MFVLIQGFNPLGGMFKIPKSRIYLGQGRKIEHLPELEELAKSPTIAMEEGAPFAGGYACFVQLCQFSLTEREVEFSMVRLPDRDPFPASLFEKYKTSHQLSSSYNWGHTCWQFGEGNIYETIYREQSAERPNNTPKIFTLRNPPEIDLNRVACMMPFAEDFDDVYTSIQNACMLKQMTAHRVDEVYSNKPIIDDVIEAIDTARIVVCDLTGRNANVLYEAGISHAIGREVIIIAQDIEADVPFDLRHLRCIGYNGKTQSGRDELTRQISVTIERILD